MLLSLKKKKPTPQPAEATCSGHRSALVLVVFLAGTLQNDHLGFHLLALLKTANVHDIFIAKCNLLLGICAAAFRGYRYANSDPIPGTRLGSSWTESTVISFLTELLHPEAYWAPVNANTNRVSCRVCGSNCVFQSIELFYRGDSWKSVRLCHFWFHTHKLP